MGFDAFVAVSDRLGVESVNELVDVVVTVFLAATGLPFETTGEPFGSGAVGAVALRSWSARVSHVHRSQPNGPASPRTDATVRGLCGLRNVRARSNGCHHSLLFWLNDA